MVWDALFHFGILSPRVSKAFERLTKVWFKFKIFPALIIYDRYNVAWYVIDMVPIMYVFVCMNVGYKSCFAIIIMFSWLTLSSDPFYMIQYWNVSIWHGSRTQFSWEWRFRRWTFNMIMWSIRGSKTTAPCRGFAGNHRGSLWVGCGTGQFGYGSGHGEAGAGATAWVVMGGNLPPRSPKFKSCY